MYPKLDIVSFGRQLFSTGDLDPVYVSLIKANLDREVLARWLLCYWLFYNFGFAGYAAAFEKDSFWKLLDLASDNAVPAPTGGRWGRGTERRHFRGRVSSAAIRCLRDRYGSKPEDMLDYLSTGSLAVGDVIRRVELHVGFGSWIGFKVADMIDAVWLPGSVVQDKLSLFLYDTPRASIDLCYQIGLLSRLPRPNCDKYEYAFGWLFTQLNDCLIPHKPQSPPDWFSLETVWCKHLSHMHGFYPLYKDTKELAHGVVPWSKCSSIASVCASHLPSVSDSYNLLG